MSGRVTVRLFMIFLGLLAVTGLSSCTVDYDTGQEDIYYCEDNGDCLAPQFTCIKNICQRDGIVPPCEDSDEDGYTADGSPNCANPGKIDCNDDDKTIYPGAPELCDGKNNNCDAGDLADEPNSCEVGNPVNCPNDGPEGTVPKCPSGTCVFAPLLAGNPGCDITISCNNGTYDPVPAQCQ